MIKKTQYRKAVFILCYAIEKEVPQYLLLKRKLHWKGWEFPKGRIEKGETKIGAARRELKEETGHTALKIRNFHFSGKYKYKKILPDRPNIIGQTFSLYGTKIKKEKVSLDKREHSGHRWVNFNLALKMLKWPDQKKSLRIVNSWLNNELQKNNS